MRKLIMGMAIIAALVMTSPAMAGGGCWYNCGDTTNIDDHSITATGGNAEVKNSGNSAVAVGNSVFGDTFSPKATIEEGAVKVAQGQLQGQGQAQKNELTIIEAETKRDHIGGSAAYGAVGSYNGMYKRGAEYLPIAIITAVKRDFSYEAAVEDLGKKFGDGKVSSTGHSYNGRHLDNPSKSVEVFTSKSLMNLTRPFKIIGFLTLKAQKEGVDSFMVMQKGVLNACNMQGDAMVVTSEGSNSEPRSSGWGIGTFVTGGQIADHGNRGNATTGGGGTGFSKTKSRLLTMPWMTIQVIKYIN